MALVTAKGVGGNTPLTRENSEKIKNAVVAHAAAAAANGSQSPSGLGMATSANEESNGFMIQVEEKNRLGDGQKIETEMARKEVTATEAPSTGFEPHSAPMEKCSVLKPEGFSPPFPVEARRG